jgi:hypothetical protein
MDFARIAWTSIPDLVLCKELSQGAAGTMNGAGDAPKLRLQQLPD